MYTVKFNIVIAVLTNKNNFRGLGIISVRVLDDHINLRINHIQYYLTKELIIF